jgi:predicted AlkP superfamily pyrophosphatase or phosphodiesterase
MPAALANSGFGAATLGVATAGFDEGDQAAWAAAVAAAARAPRALVYTYDRSLDHAGHAHGVGSSAWRAALSRLDAAVAALRAALDDEVVLLVTGDHGMVDVPAARRLRIEETPELAADVDRVGGEARLRHLYTARPAAVAARWSDRLGAAAWALPRAEAVERGWFGPVEAVALGRLGDVVVAVLDDSALLSAELPFESRLVGMHGALTSQEMLVPLFALV